MYYKSNDGIVSCKFGEVKDLEVKGGRCLITLENGQEGILMEPPMSEYTEAFIRKEFPDLDFKPTQQEMEIEKIENISLDHIVPINLFLRSEISKELFPRLHKLSAELKELPGFENVTSQGQFEEFMKGRLNGKIKDYFEAAFEELKGDKAQEYLFALQLMSRSANSSKNDDTI